MRIQLLIADGKNAAFLLTDVQYLVTYWKFRFNVYTVFGPSLGCIMYDSVRVGKAPIEGYLFFNSSSDVDGQQLNFSS